MELRGINFGYKWIQMDRNGQKWILWNSDLHKIMFWRLFIFRRKNCKYALGYLLPSTTTSIGFTLI